MRQGWGILSVAIVLALTVPSASAGRVQGTVEASHASFSGQLTATLPRGAILLEPQTAVLQLAATRADVTIHEAPPERPGLLDALLNDHRSRTSSFSVDAPTGLAFLTRGAAMNVLLFVRDVDSGKLSVATESAELSVAGRGDVAPTRAARDAGAHSFAYTIARPELHLSASDAAARAEGSVLLFLFDANAVLSSAGESRTLSTARIDGQPARVAVIRFTAATVAGQAANLDSYAPEMAMRLSGTMTTEEASGELAAAGPERRVDRALHGSPMEVEGRFEFLASAEGDKAVFTFGGSIQRLTLGADTTDFAAPPALLGGAVLAVAALAKQLKLAALGLYARIRRNDVLSHEARERVFGLVSQFPGMDVKEIAATLRVSWSTAAYHLQVLEREKLVFSRRAGRSRVYFENGRGALVSEPLSLLRNPVARKLLLAVGARPGIGQKGLAHALSLPPSTVSWHMRRLRDAGLVSEQRSWREAHYTPGHRWELAASPARPGEAATAPPAEEAPASRSVRATGA